MKPYTRMNTRKDNLMKKGQVVNVYEDPITRKHLIGEFILIRLITSSPYTMKLKIDIWVVKDITNNDTHCYSILTKR